MITLDNLQQDRLKILLHRKFQMPYNSSGYLTLEILILSPFDAYIDQ